MFYFTDNEIDDDAFPHLDAQTIRELIPKVGPRIKFVQKFEEFRARNGADDVDGESVVETDEVNQQRSSLTCFKCLKKTKVSELFIHLQYVHGINTNTTTHIVCPECQLGFAHCKTYKKHVKRHHQCLQQKPDDVENQNIAHTNCHLEYGEEDTIGEENECDNMFVIDSDETLQSLLTKEMTLFLANLKYKSIPTSSIKIITENMGELISTAVGHAEKAINTVHKEWEDGCLNHQSFTKALGVLDSMKSSLRDLHSESLQVKYFIEKGALILSVQKVLGNRYVAKLNRNTGRMEQLQKDDTFQYIPIGKVLTAYLQQPGMMRIILNEVRSVADEEKDVSFLKSYRDGELYKAFFREGGDFILPMLIYCDDFETVNPLGSRRGIHKLCAFYLSLPCLPRKYQSALSNILLVALVKSKLITRYGLNSVLEVICDDLQRIYNEGIPVNCQEFKGSVFPRVFQVVGDNLAVNSVLGFSSGFTANYFCRECRSHRNECQTQVVEKKDDLRTKQNFAEDLLIGNLTLTGVATNSSLNTLSYFHVVDNSTFDIMHDLLEGVVPLTVKLVLKELIDEEAFSLEELNSRIVSFSYGFVDKQNCPTPITMSSLMNPKGSSGQKAAQMNCLFTNLGLLIGDKVERHSESWQVFCSLLEIYKLLQAPCISVEATFMLKAKIEEYLQLYQDTFNIPFTPKQHFLVHYPRCIRLLGPLNAFTCMRFEAKHKELKQIANNSKNFINIAKTVAEKHQMKQCYGFLLKQDVEQREIEIFGQDVVPASTLQCAETVCQALQCPLYADVTLASAVQICGYKYRPHTCVLCDWNEELPQFGEVLQIIIFNGTINFLVQSHTTLFYDTHYCAYAVKITSDKVQLIQACELKDYRPLHTVQSYDENNQNYYIVLRFQPA